MVDSKSLRQWTLGWGSATLVASLSITAHAAAADAPATVSTAIASAIVDAEYSIGPNRNADPSQGEAWQAPNRAHGFRAVFSPGGITLVPRTTEESWRFGLRLAGWGRAGALTVAEAPQGTVAGNEIVYARGVLVERYVNDRRGLEQIFQIESPPQDDGDVRGRVVLDLVLSGNLVPSFAEDGQAVDFATSNAMKVLRYGSLRVVDARGAVLPSWMEPLTAADRSGVRLVFADADAVYPVTVDPLATTAAWSVESNQAGGYLGYSVSTAGDVNGDGFSDVVVGAPLYDNGQSDEGRAYVFLGSASGLATNPAWTVESDQAGANLGWSVATAGDIDADGYADVIIGAPLYDNFQGRVTLYRGSAAGLATTPAWTMESGQTGARMGWALGTAGDVNGDGYADVIIGAYDYANGQSDEGRACVFLGSASGLSATPSWTVESNQVSAQLGSSVATAGDVNGDGYADVIVGAPGFDNGQGDEGRAYVYLGSAIGLSTTPATTVESDQISAMMGASVSTAGDVNGDGYADVLVGAPNYDDPEVDEGRMYIYLGSAAGLQAVPIPLEENQAGAHFGNSVATAGDVNGDGYADVIAGAFAFDFGATDEGRVFLFPGYGGGVHLATWTAVSGQSQAGFGFAVATAGDVNGDGYSDVIVGAEGWDNGQSNEGRATVYLGSAAGLANSPFTVKESNQATADFGGSVAAAGDVNGDGYSDVLVGAPYFDNGESNEGRAFLYLGIPGGININPDWTAEPDVAGATFGWAVSGAGDVNGDGYADVIVGAPGIGGGLGGSAYVYLGSPAGLAAAPTWFTQSTQINSEYGSAVASAGDVNGDGFGDVIVGADSFGNGQNGEGQAYVYLGSASGLSTTPVWTQEPNQGAAFFGFSVAGAGDVNGDGFSDIIVGAWGRQTPAHPSGEAYVYLGSATGPETTPTWTGGVNTTPVRYGSSVASAGDVNGDGYADIIVGGYYYTHPESFEGGAFLYLGGPSGPANSPAWTGEADSASAYFGTSVASAGDVNGDGYGDVVVGADGYSNGQATEGRAYVYLGSAAGLSATPSWTYESDIAGAALGSSAASAGDVNGDGFADVIVGAPLYANGQTSEGAMYLFLGGDRGNGKSDRRPRQARLNGTTPVAPLGIPDSETSFRIRQTGRTPAGTDRVRMEWEVKLLGTPFNGVGIVTTPDQVTNPTIGFPFNEPVTGLSEGTFYHWRARLTSRNPLFPHTLWMSQAGSNITETKLRTPGCLDRDQDGYGELSDPSCASLVVDCDDTEPLVWDIPGPTENLRFTSKTVFVWDVPADPGAPPAGLHYDTLRTGDPANFLLADCLETYDGPNTTATDATSPSLGFAFFYLTRARSYCGVGPQPLGTNSAGAPRAGRSCP